MRPERRTSYKRHVREEMVIVVGCWSDHTPTVLGAVSKPTYEALVEQDKWEERKQEYMDSDIGEDIDPGSLREMLVHVWIPDVYDMPDIHADDAEPLGEDS